MPPEETFREDTGEAVVSTMEQQTLNDAGKKASPGEGEKVSSSKESEAYAKKSTEAGISSMPDRKNEEGGELLSTTDMVPTQQNDVAPIPGSEKGGKKEEVADDKGKLGKEKKPGADDDKRRPFHEEPRFKQVIEERDGFRERAFKAEGKLEGGAGKKEDVEEDFDFDAIEKMDDDEIFDEFKEDPKKFLANFGRQIRHEVTKNVIAANQQESYRDDVHGNIKAYADKNPTFDKMWKAKEIQDYQADHPGECAISAHRALTLEDTLTTRSKKDVGEAIDKERANYRTKGHASVLGEGASRAAAETDQGVPSQLKDTKKFGGINRVLTDFVENMRAGR